MPKKSSAHLQKLTTLLKISIFMAKLKKPIIPNKLISLKKMKRVKNLKLLKQYSSYYGYVKEYEFSPSNNPLVGFRRKSVGRASFRKLCDNVLVFSKCLGGGEDDEMRCFEMGFDDGIVGDGDVGTKDSTAAIDLWEDESVDERAERFIQRFYQEMMRQREEMQ